MAIAIAKAKLCKVDINATLDLANQYICNAQEENVPDTDFFRHAFAPSVLKHICIIRSGLLKVKRDTDASALLRAAMLGCLHGPRSKHIEAQSYFSNQMPRTFGAKPDYSVRYWRKNGLIAPNVSVIAVLQRKLFRLQEPVLHNNVSLADARLGDSRYAKSLPSAKRDFSIVITSPPYYGMRTYVEDQWLRNWFLGGEDHVQYGTTKQLEHTGKDVFIESLGSVWKNMCRVSPKMAVVSPKLSALKNC